MKIVFGAVCFVLGAAIIGAVSNSAGQLLLGLVGTAMVFVGASILFFRR